MDPARTDGRAGVQVDGEWVDPYGSPDTMVNSFDTSGLVFENLESIASYIVTTSDWGEASPSDSHHIGFCLGLATHRHGRRTLAAEASRTIVIPSPDEGAHIRLISMIEGTFMDAGCLEFPLLYNRALGRDNGSTGTYIWRLVHRATLQDQTCNYMSMCIGKLFGVVQAIDQAVLPSTFTLPVAMPLYDAWQYYVRNWRRPHFEVAKRRVDELEAHVEDLAAGILAQGAQPDIVREVCLSRCSL